MKESLAVLLFSGVVLLSASCVAGPVVNDTAEKNRVDTATMLDAHNSWREQVGVAELSWSADLEQQAISWANELKESNRCRMKHSGPGENLYWASAIISAY